MHKIKVYNINYTNLNNSLYYILHSNRKMLKSLSPIHVLVIQLSIDMMGFWTLVLWGSRMSLVISWYYFPVKRLINRFPARLMNQYFPVFMGWFLQHWPFADRYFYFSTFQSDADLLKTVFACQLWNTITCYKL